MNGCCAFPLSDAPPQQGVLLSNIARRDTRTAAANPTDPWLELEVAEQGGRKTSKSSADGTWNEHVASVDVEVASGALADLTNMFHVFVDGQPYGPFQRVSALRLYAISMIQLTLCFIRSMAGAVYTSLARRWSDARASRISIVFPCRYVLGRLDWSIS